MCHIDPVLQKSGPCSSICWSIVSVWQVVSQFLHLPHLVWQPYAQLLYGHFQPELNRYSKSTLYVINVVSQLCGTLLLHHWALHIM
ncbi:hypothetical protein GDO81_008410 [Engystomops pustulosus]|uniref:Uncharacterized protein n=1 Tax=Engystomops pustulosus TaxID=76066 RepID=A0AAV7CFB7_ENGPU|nr:hypothetical protein GDO81_008410 [Engystomops pustulosus]